jgi:hypothetical protein
MLVVAATPAFPDGVARHGATSRRSTTVKPPSVIRATPPADVAARRLASADHDDTALALIRADTIGLIRCALSGFSAGGFTALMAIGASLAQPTTIAGAAGPAPAIASSIRPWWLSFKAWRLWRSEIRAVAIFPPFAAWRLITDVASLLATDLKVRRVDRPACTPRSRVGPTIHDQLASASRAVYQRKFPFRHTGSCFSLRPAPISDAAPMRTRWPPKNSTTACRY